MLKMPKLEELEIPPDEDKLSLPAFRMEYVTVSLVGILLILAVVSMVRVESRLTAAQSAVTKLGARFPTLNVAETMAELDQENKQVTAELIESKAATVRLQQQVADLEAKLKDQAHAAQAVPCDASGVAGPRNSGKQLNRLVTAIKSAVPY